MPTVTLDSIREATEAKYEPVTIPFGEGESATLIQALRLNKERRKRMAALQAGMQDIDSEAEDAEDQMVAALRDMLRCAATHEAEVDRLLEVVGDDMAVLLGIVEAYGAATQLPEALPSPS